MIVHTIPGDTLKETLECKGMTVSELAEQMRYPQLTISSIIAGTQEITPDIAKSLAWTLGIPEHFWLERQRLYDIHSESDDESDESEGEDMSDSDSTVVCVPVSDYHFPFSAIIEEHHWDFDILFQDLRMCERCGNVINTKVKPKTLILCQKYVFESTVNEYRQKLRTQSYTLPPLTVLYYEGTRIVLDGNHRLIAHILEYGFSKEVPVNVYCSLGE